MICDDCKKCNYFFVSEVGCYGSDKPCENFFPSDYEFPNSEEADNDRKKTRRDNIEGG